MNWLQALLGKVVLADLITTIVGTAVIAGGTYAATVLLAEYL
jgi:hypothetical protein